MEYFRLVSCPELDGHTFQGVIVEDLFVLVSSLLDAPDDWTVIAELDNAPEASTSSHMYMCCALYNYYTISSLACTCTLYYTLCNDFNFLKILPFLLSPPTPLSLLPLPSSPSPPPSPPPSPLSPPPLSPPLLSPPLLSSPLPSPPLPSSLPLLQI